MTKHIDGGSTRMILSIDRDFWRDIIEKISLEPLLKVVEKSTKTIKSPQHWYHMWLSVFFSLLIGGGMECNMIFNYLKAKLKKLFPTSNIQKAPEAQYAVCIGILESRETLCFL